MRDSLQIIKNTLWMRDFHKTKNHTREIPLKSSLSHSNTKRYLKQSECSKRGFENTDKDENKVPISQSGSFQGKTCDTKVFVYRTHLLLLTTQRS